MKEPLLSEKNNMVIKLPINNIDKALKNIHYIMNNKNFLDVKLIDLRIKDQIILNDK